MILRKRAHLFSLISLLFVLFVVNASLYGQDSENDSTETSFGRLNLPLEYKTPYIAPFPTNPQNPGLSFAGTAPPLLSNRKTKYSSTPGWDAKTGNLYYTRSINNHQVETPRYADYMENAKVYGQSEVANYWRQNLYNSTKKAERDKGAGLFNIQVDLGDQVGGLVKAIAGEGTAGLDVTGYQKISFSGRSQWTDKEQDALNRVSKFPSLDMEQVSRYSITGTIGSKITVEVDQNSERKTDLANTIKIRYKGSENEIIQSIEAGNTNLSLPNTQFVGYSQRVQGLFGIKATAKVGALDLTAIVSQEKGSTESSSFEAGAAKSTNYKRDYDYLDRTFFWLFGPEDDVDSIIESEIYVFQPRTDQTNTDITTEDAYVAYDPANYGADNTEDQVTTVKRLDYQDYYVYNKSMYLEMLTYDRTRLIAGWFRVRKSNGDIVEIGSHNADTLSLKLIALDQNTSGPKYKTWDNEWRNVYSLGARDIDPEGIDVQIYKGEPGTETQADKNLSHQNGTPYIQIMGLDTRDVTGANTPDNKIDAKDNNILLRDRGYLIFPDPHPFDPSRSYAPNSEPLDETVPAIYNERRSTITSNPTQYTKYYIQFETAQRQTEYYLGRVNIIENSERVILNGEELQKDRDYKIYYEIGRINFLTDAVSDPNADLKIDFEYEPFITSEKKNLFGVRGEYEINPDFKIGSTVLYKGEKSTDRKPRVGQETSKSLVWDGDFRYATDLPFLTSLTDALPFVEATAPSRLSISGEIAQSRPNPNTAGEAYVDDFESAKEAYSLGITRYQWTKSSAPVPAGVDPKRRGGLIWFNPYDPYSVTDIYNRDSRGNDRKTTLSMIFTPHDYYLEDNPEDSCNPIINESAPDESWAGVMRAFSSGSQNQTQAQLLEIRMKINNGRPPTKGRLYIDLGDISEDINGDGALNTEDTNSNGILEIFEDTGLDNKLDSNEACYDAVSNPDPSGDDFNYDDKNDYSKINGTEGNRFDAGGNRPDTEDLDGKGSLNTINNYFEFMIDFADDQFRVEGSNLNGWETYRIPISDTSKYQIVNSPDWGRIPYGRIWMSDFDSTVLVEIADINLVSTRWEEDSIRPIELDRASAPVQPAFNVSVINTEENLDYTPPPGVSGYYDKTTDTYEKEQSLLLHFENLQFYPVDSQITIDSGQTIDTVIYVADTAVAGRDLFQAEDYAGYQKIEMYVHGPDSLPEGPSNIHFVFRMGTNDQNFYQYQTNIWPGWSDSNRVVIDFNEITQLKDKLFQQQAEDPKINFIQEGKYAVKGRPSLTSILYFGAAVTNTDTLNHQPISGDIWMDELRVTDVRNDPGTAMRFTVSGGLSDFVSYSVNYNKQDAYFRNLTSSNSRNLGSGNSENSINYSTKINLHKILPPSWGASLPISWSWSERKATPRLKSGSDIIIPDEQKELETSRSTNKRFSISQSFRKQGGNLLFGILLNRLKTSYSYSESDSKTPTVPISKSQSYQAKATYDMTPSRSVTIPILFWLKPIPLLPKALSESQLGLLPSKLTLAGTVKKNYSLSVNNQNYKSSTYNRTLNGNLQLGWNIFRSMVLDYSMQTDRDIRSRDDINFSLNPSKMKLGTELENNQNFRLDYAPSLFRWLTHKFSYRATFRENADPARNDYGTRNVNGGNTFTINGSFSPQTFFGRGNSSAPAAKTDSTKGGGFSLHKPFLKFIRFFTNRIDDISGSYSVDKKSTIWGLEDRPTWKYILGFTDDPGAGINSEAVSRTARDVSTNSKSYNARSAFKFILGTRISTSYSRMERESNANSNKSVSTGFPDLSFSLTNLERYGVFRFFFNNLSIDTRYSKKTDETFRTATTEYLSDKAVTDNYSPFLKLNFTWFRKLQCTLQYDKSISVRDQYNQQSDTNDAVIIYYAEKSNGVRTTSKNWQFTARTTLSSPNGIKFPIFGTLKSTLTFNISISKKNTKSENTKYKEDGWSTTSDRSDFTVMPRIAYSFSTNINGGLSARWQDSNDKTRFQKSHVRELGLWVEIKF